jgi:hypothetical protein
MHVLALQTRKLIVLTIRGAIHVTSLVILPRTVHTEQKGNVTKQVKGKPWCSHHKINTHASESCWALHPELRPSYLKERAAQSA